MNRSNAAIVRRLRNAFTGFQQEVNAALRELEHSNNVFSCSYPDIEKLIMRVCASYHIEPSDLVSRKRDAGTAWARQVCMFLAARKTSHTHARIALVFGRGHQMVKWSEEAVVNRMSTDKRIKAEVEELLK